MIFDSSRNHYSSSSYLPPPYLPPTPQRWIIASRIDGRIARRSTWSYVRWSSIIEATYVRMWIRCDQRGRIEGSAHRENASVKPRDGCQRSVEKDSRQKIVFSARTVYLGIIPLRVRSYTISQGSRCNVCIYIYIHKCALECVRVYASISLSLSLYLSIYLSIYLSFRLFIHLLYVCVNGYPCVWQHSANEATHQEHSTSLHRSSICPCTRSPKLRSLYITLRTCTFVHKNS